LHLQCTQLGHKGKASKTRLLSCEQKSGRLGNTAPERHQKAERQSSSAIRVLHSCQGVTIMFVIECMCLIGENSGHQSKQEQQNERLVAAD
jgi:hypothetical protein